MLLGCSHVVLNASDVAAAREFYAGKLGFVVIEDHPTMFAFAAGGVRFSVFGGGRRWTADEGNNLQVIFRTDDLAATVRDLKTKGVTFLGEIEEAPGFMRHIVLADPDNNTFMIGEYLADPLQPHAR